MYLKTPMLGPYQNVLPDLVPCHPEALHSLSSVLTELLPTTYSGCTRCVVFRVDGDGCAGSAEQMFWWLLLSACSNKIRGCVNNQVVISQPVLLSSPAGMNQLHQMYKQLL